MAKRVRFDGPGGMGAAPLTDQRRSVISVAGQDLDGLAVELPGVMRGPPSFESGPYPSDTI
ncbi:MAG TPA: hypothetical protein VFB92_16215 [Vicinamibacterales bacterium]|nr:hypothetical protein [Vicinamibacterales bacterium]